MKRTVFALAATAVLTAPLLGGESVNYNPSGNPEILSSLQTAEVGGNWSVALDCSASDDADGVAVLRVADPSQSQAHPGLNTKFGYLYVAVSPGSGLNLAKKHAQSAKAFSAAIPPDPSLEGTSFSIQGFCQSSSSYLSNGRLETIASPAD